MLVALNAKDALASFLMQLAGTITVTADKAPVREAYPDGRILAVAPRGTKLTVHAAVGDGRGTWVSVTYKKYKDGEISGYIASDLTSFWDDFNKGRLK